MASFNKVIIVGNLTRDPELRYTPKGMAVAQGGIAVNRNWTTESGEKREEVTFIDFTSWGRIAENLAQYKKKGESILIEGRLKLDQWDDKQTGQKRQKLSVVAESITFLGGGTGGERSEHGGFDRTKTAKQNAAASAPKSDNDGYSDGPPPDDDVPF